MNIQTMCSRVLACLIATALTLGGASAAFADDTEIFVGLPTTTSAPNIMFIMDTSGSMGTNVVSTVAYVPATTYAGSGSCSGLVSSDRVYYTTGSAPPSCSSDQWVPATDQHCFAANDALLSGTGSGVYGPDNIIRWVRSNSGGGGMGGSVSDSWRWRRNSFNNDFVQNIDCQADAGTSPYPKAQSSLSSTEDSSSTAVYTTSAGASYWNAFTSQQYRLYSANYVVYYNQHRIAASQTRMQIMQSAATQMLSSLTGVNVGLMRYSTDANGGYVVAPVSPVETARASLTTTVNAFTSGGNTPLSETLFEAERYFSSGAVLYGVNSSPAHSIDTSRTPATTTGADYNSPADFACQKNYVVYLTDGLPTSDVASNTDIAALNLTLPAADRLSCTALGPNGSSSDGKCLASLTNFMNKADLRTGTGAPAEKQNVTSYFIGLGDDFVDSTTSQLNAAYDYLQTAAVAGGGEAFQANDLDSLTVALNKITTNILDDASSFAAPTVGVNAFNRTRNLDELYISLFKPSTTYHWAGNVKKYKLVGGQLRGRTSDPLVAGPPAVDPLDGLFKATAQEYWSAVVDGRDVDKGGVVSNLPAPASRHLYTYLSGSGSTDLSDIDNAISIANSTLVSDTVLGTGGAGQPTRTQLIDWMHGVNVQGEVIDNVVPAARKKSMGDPLHAQPAVVVYGGTATTPDINDAVLYVATNDGYLHAVNASTGVELWAYIPAELLGDQVSLYNDDSVPTRHYGLDSDIKVEKFDVDGNGIVDGNDKVVLYFGMGRGGNNYYAVDVTDKAHPKFMWTIGSGELPGVGQTWSPPVLANVHVSGTPSQNTQRLVLIFGGGYDPAEDGSDISGVYNISNSVGNHVFMVDAITGLKLWSAGPSTGTDDLKLARMDHAIPAGITVLDLNGDGYADRMYAGDMAGQVWRFDIYNGNAKATLVTGGVMASLGARDITGHPNADARRFYASPDISLVASRTIAPYLNVAIGSGYRGHPLNTAVHDRFYALRDFNISNKLTQAQYNAYTVVQDSGLVDITSTMTPTLVASDKGWMLRLDQNGGWVGEKVLGSATTLGGRVLFTTYTPSAGGPSTDCTPNTGTNRAYAINVVDGSAVLDVDGTTGITIADRSVKVEAGSIVGEITVLFMGDGRIPVVNPESCTAGTDGCTCVGTVCTRTPPPCQEGDPNCTCDTSGVASSCHLTNPDTVCTAGVSVIPVCTQTNRLRKTFWMENAAN
jgi:type IV pilus assembly protein PilY1